MIANVMAGIVAFLRKAAGLRRDGGAGDGKAARLEPSANVVAASLQAAKPSPPVQQPRPRVPLRWLLPTINLVTTALASTALIVASLSYTAATVAELAGLAEVKTTNLRSGAVPVAASPPADGLDVAPSVPVVSGDAPEQPSPDLPEPAATPEPAMPGADLLEAGPPEAAPPGDALADDSRSRVVISAVRLRSGPSNDAEPIGTVAAGVDVEVLAEMDGWIRIVTPDRRVGWVYRRFLGADDGAAAPAER